jgi:RNA polymerase sigma-70 factor, ECF subfamily
LHQAADNAAQDMSDVERVLAGETRAFEGIVRRWQAPLVNLAWRYCRDRGRAEEMAQEAFLRTWRGLKQWRRDSSFSSWLFAVAANVYRNELKRLPMVTVGLEETSEPRRSASQLSDLEQRTRNETLRRAVLALPMRYREPVVLYYFHEMDVSTAAHTLALREGTLKARLARARSLLARRFPHLKEESSSMHLSRGEA